ncbi:hypothetical protein OAI33_09665 [Pirellulaceae bacterium]|nr:hypothetical protein [Pirellulaceae bacterium]
MPIDITLVKTCREKTNGPWRIHRGDRVVSPYVREQIEEFLSVG